MFFVPATDVNLSDTEEYGAMVAKRDIERFGTLHAMDKLGYLEDGPFAIGYANEIAQQR